MDFGKELRRLREAAGLSQAALTARIHYSKSHLSKVENGRTRANREFAEACDAVLGTGDTLSALVAAAPATGFSGLPAPTTHLVGRHDELARIHAVLLDTTTPACVLDGMAGVGKTALALRAAWDAEPHFPDGCLFFDLRGDSSEVPFGDVLDSLLRTLGVPGADIPPDPDSRANLYRTRLRGRRMLLVFDNVRSARQVVPLLPAEPGSRVLITSRNRLNALDDAVHVSIGMLSTAQAVELFRAIAGPELPAEPLARIAAHCGRLPLAVRIAAARFRSSPVWTIEEFASRLGDLAARLSTLDDGERSVAAAFSLSYQGLPADQQRLFGLLALHPGREVATRNAAALAGLGIAETERLLDRLGDAYLVLRRPGGYTTFHDLVRVFALEHALPSAADQDAALRRLLDLSLSRAAASDSVLAPQRYRPVPSTPAESFSSASAALAWLDVEWPNLVALCGTAAERGLSEGCWQLALLLRDFFFRTKLWSAWIHTHEVAASAARAADDSHALALTVNNLGMAHADRGDLRKACGYYEEALALFRSLDDSHGTTSALSNLAWVNLYLGSYEAALRDMTTALESYRHAGARRNFAITLRGIALLEVELGLDAVPHATSALDEARELGLELDVTMALNLLGWVHFRAGSPDSAAAFYSQAVESGERSGSTHEVARALIGLGNVAHTTGDDAIGLWQRAAEIHGPLNPVMVGEERVCRSLAQR